MPCVKPTVVNGPHNRFAALRQVIEQDTIIQEVAMNVVYINPAKRNVLDLKNETCKNREKRNVLKNSHTRYFKAIKKQSVLGCFYSF